MVVLWNVDFNRTKEVLVHASLRWHPTFIEVQAPGKTKTGNPS
jgi:hypothetical protein